MRRRLAATSAVALVLGLLGWVASGTFAIFHGETDNTGSTFQAANDFQAPSVTASVLAATSSGNPVGGAGWVHQGGTYRIYANVTDNLSSGNQITATADVSPDVNGTGTGIGDVSDTAVALTFDSTGVTIGGTTYHYISAQKTAANPLAASGADTKSHQITADDAASNSASAMFTKTGVDNTVPTTTMSNPGSPLTGTVSLQSTSADTGGSGIASVTYEKSPNLANTFTTACIGTTTPFSCNFNTATVSDGAYDFRSRAIDNAGNLSANSATLANKVIDNNAPTAPTLALGGGATLSDSVTYTASSTDAGSGVNRIELQVAPTGTSTWVTVCSVTGGSATLANTASPCTGKLDNKTVIPTDAQGYDFRAVAFDNAGFSTPSSNVLTRTVDNSPFAVDIQPSTGGNNIPSSGDTLTYTFSESVTPSSILAGFTGTAKAVTVSIANASSAQLTVVGTNLGSVDTDKKFVSGGGCTSEDFTASMSMSGSILTVSLTNNGTSVPATKCNLSAQTSTTFKWTPSGSVTDSSAHSMLTTQVTEGGTADSDW